MIYVQFRLTDTRDRFSESDFDQLSRLLFSLIKLKDKVEERVGQQQRKYMLTEQLKQIKRELGIEKDDKDSILQAFRDVLETRRRLASSGLGG